LPTNKKNPEKMPREQTIAKRKKAEEELRDSELRFRSVYENSFDAVLLTKPDGCILAANPAAQRMFGMSEEEVRKAGRNGLVVIDERAEPALKERARTGKAKSGFTFRRKDGSTFEGEAASSVFTDSDGIVKTSMIIRDITERKKAEEALKASEERFRTVQENSLDRFTILKPFFNDQGEIVDFIFVYQNARAAKLTGRKPEELVGLRMTEVYPTFPQTRFFSMYKRAFETRRVIKFEDHYQADRVEDWFLVVVTPISDGIAITTQIITTRKKVEETLKQSEEKYRNIVETTQEGILVTDLEGKITFANKRIADYLGYTVNELMGKSGLDLALESEKPSAQKRMEKRREGIKEQYEIWMRRKDGGKICFLANGSPLLSNQGLHIGNLGMYVDITERKKADEKIARLSSFPTLNPNPIVEIDFEGKVEYANPSAKTEFSEIEALGSKHPFLADYKSLIQIFNDKTANNIISEIKIGDNWYLQQYSKVPKSQCIRIYAIDITERKKAEESVTKAKEQYDLLFNSVTEGFAYYKAVCDGNGKLNDILVLDINPSGALQSGVSCEGQIGKTWRQVWAGIPESVFDIYNQVMQTGAPYTFEHLSPITNRWYLSNVTLIAEDQFAVAFFDITDLKKTEEALKQSQELISKQLEEIKSYYDNAPVGLAILDRDLRYIRVNTLFAEMDGMPAEEHIGKTVREVVPTLAEQAEELPRKMFKSGEAVRNIEFIGETAACPGEKRAWLESWIPIKDSSRQVTALYVMAEDITERKKAEEALKTSEEKYRQLFNSIDEGFCIIEVIFDTNGRPIDYRFLEVNALFEQQTGLHDVVGKLVRSLVPAHEEHWFRIYGGVALSGKPIRFEDEAKALNRFYDVFAFPVGMEKPYHVGVLFKDIAERKKDEETLKENEQLYHTIFDNSQDGFQLIELVYDKHGKPIDHKFLKVNHAYEKIIGVKADDILDKTAKYISPNQEFHWLEVPDRVAKTGISEHVELYNKDIGKWLDCFYFRYSKNVVGTLFRDITGRKKLEKQLQDSERLAAIGATAGMVGHDIRNPLQAITGDLYLVETELAELSDNEQKKNAMESVDEIQNNIDYINKIVADLQDYAKPLNPQAQETDLTSVFKDMLTKNGIPKNVKVTVDVEEKARHVMADADFLKRIVGNLILNAVQAMLDGGELTICSCIDKRTNDTLITVNDTGVGIPEDVKPKLFTPMMTTKSKGQGFGLAVVKRMTEGLGGTVTFESIEGKGTTFIVRLPLPRAKR